MEELVVMSQATFWRDRPVIRSDGTQIRDYFSVEDGAAANIALAEALHARPELRGEAFNFSNDIQMDVLDRTITWYGELLARD